jgi:hypothetical protein
LSAARDFDDVGGWIGSSNVWYIRPLSGANHGDPGGQVFGCFRIFNRFPFQVRFFDDPHAHNLYALKNRVDGKFLKFEVNRAYSAVAFGACCTQADALLGLGWG